MGETLNQPCRVKEEGPLGRKLLLCEDNCVLYVRL